MEGRRRGARNRDRPSDCWLRSVLAASAAASVGGAAASRSRPAQRSVARAAYDIADEDQELAESLKERTLESLDFDFVLEKLQALCYTSRAAEMAMKPAELMAGSAEEARELYAAVLELTCLEDADLNLVAKLDIDQEVDSCSRGAVLEPPQLQKISDSIEALLRLRNGLEAAGARGVQIPVLLGFCEQIELADELLDVLLEAFEEDGELSEDKFPELRSMRDDVRQLTGACAEAIRSVLTSGKYSGYLSDDGYIQIGGHYCLSVKPNFKRQVGQVIDESRTGRTVYVEPFELVGPAAALIEKQQELKFTIRRILAAMSVAVSKSAETIRTSLWAAAQIDLARARLFLGEDMEGEIPDVQDEGVIQCRLGRNPCLLLRGGKRVVGYRLEIGVSSQALILSGPNAGGKTVVLKTVGLLALLARCGIPVPGGENPRVDFFESVLAEVGDMQTIVDDLSTYSAHLVASRIMLSVTRQSGPKALVLVDEAGTGTDPQQGAALARAILEAFLECGARVVATTHSMQLKNWATEDARTETAAMEYKQGQPTFRLARNAVGESHAIETAKRLQLPELLVLRAEELLTEDQQQLLALQRQAALAEKELVEATGKAEEREAQATALMDELVVKDQEVLVQKDRLSHMEVEIKAKEERMRSQMQAELKAKVDAKERQLKDLVRRLKQESANLGPGSRIRIVGDALDDIRIERDEQAEAELAQRAIPQVPGALGPNDELKLGDWVVVLARTPWYGFKGRVQHVGDQKVVLFLEGNSGRLEVTKTEVGRTVAPKPKPPKRNGVSKKETKKDQKNETRDYSKMTW